ncbi:hypothetical protein PPERSA_08179 [Pseudocohnilembus persalinus]|uniref:Uncharacterized protein n=1 Tax=Pseudocohnilembus persalinus TaxID=266149 RepID=A0A0V0R3P6_PSEPJ|nr:hypothetical protein PPERSA_08179 [Pseudocohnilembus persalinus]|eukprot:KRX08976.1 hypothetical protein PPERSA_08179 [Pseudocohnilembus persalinus]
MQSKKERNRNEIEEEEDNQPPDKQKPLEQQIGDGLNFDDIDHQMVQSTNDIDKQQLTILINDQYPSYKTLQNDVEVFVQKKTVSGGKQEKFILFQKLLEYLETKRKIVLKDCLISYFDTLSDLYVFMGKYPLQDDSTIPHEVVVGQSIEIKLRRLKSKLEDKLIEEQKQKDKDDNNEITKQKANENDNPKNRVKERKIGEVVEKVALWRRFYTGFFEEDNKFVSYQLEEAAKKVGISKKTLDDYLLQIRCGKKYGFDFNSKKNERIGTLRSFVKKEKEREKNKNNNK